MSNFDIQAIFPDAHEVLLKKGTCIYDAHQTFYPGQVYYLREGFCSLKGYSYNGTARTYIFLRAPRFINYFPLVQADAFRVRYAQKYMRMLPCEVCLDSSAYAIDPLQFQAEVLRRKELNELIICQIMDDYTELLQKFISTTEDTACARLCKFLLSYSEQRGNGLILRRFFTYKDLAEYINTHQVTVGKIMAALQKDQIIAKRPHYIELLQPQRLEQMIELQSTGAE